MGKTINQFNNGVTAVPVSTDLIPFWDTSESTSKPALLSDVIPAGINGLQYKVLAANASGGDVNTAQPWFPSAGGVAVESDKTYFFEGQLRISRAAGTTSHTTGLLFGGTAVIESIMYEAIANTGDVVTNGALNGISVEVATLTVAKAASTSATEQISIRVRGTIRVTTAGTLIPQFQYSAAPGGAPSILKNSYFRLFPIGAANAGSQGTWS